MGSNPLAADGECDDDLDVYSKGTAFYKMSIAMAKCCGKGSVIDPSAKSKDNHTRPIASLYRFGFTLAPGLRGRPVFVCGHDTLERILVLLSTIGRPRVTKHSSEPVCLV